MGRTEAELGRLDGFAGFRLFFWRSSMEFSILVGVRRSWVSEMGGEVYFGFEEN